MPSVASRFQKPLHTPPEADKSLPIPYAKVGVEIEVENCTLNSRQLAREFPGWDLHMDEASLRNHGMEFVSPAGGIIGAQLRAAISSFCTKAKEFNFSEGYPRAGIHLHIDVTDMNEESDTELLNMMLAYMLFEHMFFAFAGEWRRACGFCDALLASQHDFPAISNLLYGWKNFDRNTMHDNAFSKYAAVNFLPLERFGTVEIRHLPTTLDPVRIMDWLRLSLCLKRFGKNIDINPVDLLIAEGPDRLVKLVFKGCEKLAKKYINPDAMWQAVPEIMSLRIMRKRGKFDPWSDPDNPLLEMKRAPKPKKAEAKKKAVVETLSAAEIYVLFEAENDPSLKQVLAQRYITQHGVEASLDFPRPVRAQQTRVGAPRFFALDETGLEAPTALRTYGSPTISTGLSFEPEDDIINAMIDPAQTLNDL